MKVTEDRDLGIFLKYLEGTKYVFRLLSTYTITALCMSRFSLYRGLALTTLYIEKFNHERMKSMPIEEEFCTVL